MTRRAISTLLVLLAFTGVANAHAMLTAARPGVGSTIQVSPDAIELDFSEGVVPVFSGVALQDESGRAVRTGRPHSGSAATTLVVALLAPLKPGAYRVTWHAVSVDTHRTQGSFRFTLVR